MRDSRSHPRTTDPEFLGTLQNWLQGQPEILVEVRFRCGAGSYEYELFSTFQAVADRVRELPSGACVTAFKRPQLPLRGVVDDRFIADCLRSIPDGAEYLLIERVRRVYGRQSWYHCGSGESHAELRDDLEESRGTLVAAGLFPPVREQSPDVVYAIVPDEDGSVRAGPY